MMGNQAVTMGIVVAAVGSLLALLIWLFGGGALLMVGGRYIAKTPKATYWRSVGTMALAGLGAGMANMLIGVLSRGLGPAGPIVGTVAGSAAAVVVAWLVIRAMFQISFGKAILAWLPTLAVGLVVTGILGAALFPTLMQAQQMTNRTVCMSNLRTIGGAMMIYRSENDNKWPADLKTLSAGNIDSPKLFVCPCVRGGSRPAGRTYDYFYFPPNSGSNPRAIVICDFGDNHSDGSRNVLRVDGSIVQMSPAAFHAELAAPASAAFAAALRQAEGDGGENPAPR